MNVQFAVKGDDVYVLEVNPRASRTVPFVSKATGRPLAKIAAQGDGRHDARRARRARDRRAARTSPSRRRLSVREVPGRRHHPRPEMRSTGEVMGIDRDFAARVRQGAARRRHHAARPKGTAFISVRDEDKAGGRSRSRAARRPRLRASSPPTARRSSSRRTASRPRASTRSSRGARTASTRSSTARSRWSSTRPRRRRRSRDSFSLRRTALMKDVPVLHDHRGARAAALAIAALQRGALDVRSLQEYHS